MSRGSRSVRKPYLWASYHIHKICSFLVRGIFLPAAQLFVIAIENILRGRGVGNLTRFRHSKIVICNDYGLPCSTRETRPSKARLSMAMPPHQQEVDGPALALKDTLCMASLLIDCCVFFNKNQLELILTNTVVQFVYCGAAGSSQLSQPPPPFDKRPSDKD